VAVAHKIAPSGLTYAAGVSQRKAAEVMSLLLGHRYSHETISAMTEEVLQAVEAFRGRPLPEEMAFVYLDGLYLKLLREGEGVVREVVYVALGVTPSGERRVLGYWLLPAESALGWEGVLGELWQRGLRRVLLFITDGLPGLPEAIRRVYPQAEWQRCVVHGVRWSLGQVRARDRVLLAEDLRRVYGAESRGEALEALEALREAWGSRYPGVVALWVKSRFLWVSLPRPKASPCPGNAGKPSPPWPSASPPWPDSPGSPRRGRPQPPWSAASPHG
jgi:putative transposase